MTDLFRKSFRLFKGRGQSWGDLSCELHEDHTYFHVVLLLCLCIIFVLLCLFDFGFSKLYQCVPPWGKGERLPRAHGLASPVGASEPWLHQLFCDHLLLGSLEWGEKDLEFSPRDICLLPAPSFCLPGLPGSENIINCADYFFPLYYLTISC